MVGDVQDVAKGGFCSTYEPQYLLVERYRKTNVDFRLPRAAA